MKCNVVRELLPNYIEGLTSSETNTDIKKHLAGCESCCAVYEYMLSSHLPDEPEKEGNAGPEKTKNRPKRKRAAVLIACAILALSVLFAKNYEIPLPFDPERMFIEPFQVVPVTNEDGTVWLSDLNSLDFRSSKSVLAGNLDTKDWVRFSYRGIRNIGFWSNGRTIIRNGTPVKVVYYRYTKSLWNALLPDDFWGYNESGWVYDADGTSKGKDHEPEIQEIYYLPIRDLGGLDELTDDEFDALKEKASLIWSGEI